MTIDCRLVYLWKDKKFKDCIWREYNPYEWNPPESQYSIRNELQIIALSTDPDCDPTVIVKEDIDISDINRTTNIYFHSICYSYHNGLIYSATTRHNI